MSLFVDDTDLDPERDVPSVRVFDLGSNKIRLERQDPYGFWYISFERGQIPKMLEGAFTTLDKAVGAAQTYINNKGRTVKEDK